jgi:hypothetical protein
MLFMGVPAQEYGVQKHIQGTRVACAIAAQHGRSRAPWYLN